MATKAIYTKVNNKYYKVNQDTANPTDIVRIPQTHSQMSTDISTKLVNSDIWINTLEGVEVRSNKELYDLMIAELDAQNVTEIPTIENHFVAYCDYSVFNSEGKVIAHSAFVHPISSKDAIYILGADRASELVYKQVKVFSTDISLNVKNEYPMGIMKNSSYARYTLHINDFAIYQDLVNDEFDVHRSSNPTAYPISTVLESMTKVYSTHDNGITIGAIDIPFTPRRIVLHVNITLDDLIIAYDEREITNILIRNLGEIVEDDDPDSDEDYDGPVIIFDGGNA